MTAREFPDLVVPLIGFNPSGGVRMVIHVANELAARGHRVIFDVPGHAAAPPIPLHAGVDVRIRGRARGPAARLEFVTRLPRARAYLATGYQTPLLIALGRRHTAPIIYLIQNDEPVSHIRHGSAPALVRPLLHLIALAGYEVPATRIAVSHFVAGRVGLDRVDRVIAPGIDESFLRAVDPRPATGVARVGLLAHPGRVKGMEVALRAMEKLRDDARIQPWVFDGANAASVPPWIQRYSDIDAFYSHCDVFVFPSLVEGFGLPPLEAMARGAAVVLTDCGGVREYARHDRNALMVPAGNPEAIIDAIRRLAHDDALRARIAAAGRETALRFPLGRFVNACADEIGRVLGAPAGRNSQ